MARTSDPATVHTGRRRETPELRRAQILEAAERLVVEHGPEVSVADVAEAAGVAKGTVYLYFASKADLLSALRDRYLERFADTIGDEVADVTDAGARAALEQFAASLFDWALGSFALHHALFHESAVSEEDAFERGRAMVAAIVRRGIDAGEVRTVDPELTARFLLDGIHGLLVATMNPDAPDRARYGRAVHELVPRVLGTTLS